QVDPVSRWNAQQLAGGIRATLVNVAPVEQRDQQLAEGTLWQNLQLPEFHMDLALGGHTLNGQGSLGTPGSRLDLDLAVSRLADAWPGLPGGASLKGFLGGSLQEHALNLQAQYTPGE